MIYRRELGDLLFRLTLLENASAIKPGAPGVLYGLRFTIGGDQYEVRAGREGATPAFALYRCAEQPCTQVATLSGGLGTTGWEILVAVPLQALGIAEGASVAGLEGFTATGDTTAGAASTFDEIPLPSPQMPVAAVLLGIAPTGTPEAQVLFNTTAGLTNGNFTAEIDSSGLPGGDYQVWAKACLGATCGPAASVAVALGSCSTAVPLISVISRKAHAEAGTFDIPIPLTGAPGVECRGGDGSNDHTLVFTFANPLTSVGGASVTSGSGTVSSGAIDGSDSRNYVVNLSGITNAQVVTIRLAQVNDSAGKRSAAVLVSMAVLLGDTTGSGAVNSSDISQTKAQSGESVSASNFRQDVTVSGSINSSDISLVKSRSGTALP